MATLGTGPPPTPEERLVRLEQFAQDVEARLQAFDVNIAQTFAAADARAQSTENTLNTTLVPQVDRVQNEFCSNKH